MHRNEALTIIAQIFDGDESSTKGINAIDLSAHVGAKRSEDFWACVRELVEERVLTANTFAVFRGPKYDLEVADLPWSRTIDMGKLRTVTDDDARTLLRLIRELVSGNRPELGQKVMSVLNSGDGLSSKVAALANLMT